MNLESYKQRLAELKKVRSDATQDQKLRDENKGLFVTTCYNLNDQLDSLLGTYAGHGFEAGWDAARSNPIAANEWDKLISDLEACVEALEDITYIPGMGGLDYTSTKKWREGSMKTIDRVARECLTNLKLGAEK